jgi:hypothetical protein
MDPPAAAPVPVAVVVGDSSMTSGGVVQEDQTWILGVLAVITAAVMAYLLKPEHAAVETGPPRVPTKQEDLTLKQLRHYDGKDGRPIYIAVKGVIFNVSSHPSGIELYGRQVSGAWSYASGCAAVLRVWLCVWCF